MFLGRPKNAWTKGWTYRFGRWNSYFNVDVSDYSYKLTLTHNEEKIKENN